MTGSPVRISLPPGKQEAAEMCILLECETASLGKAHAGTALALKVTGRSRVPFLYIHFTLQPTVFDRYFDSSYYKA